MYKEFLCEKGREPRHASLPYACTIHHSAPPITRAYTIMLLPTILHTQNVRGSVSDVMWSVLRQVHNGDEACFHTVHQRPTMYKLSPDAVENLIRTFPGHAFDMSWAAWLGMRGIEARVLPISAIEDATTLKIYSRPKLIVHSVGHSTGRDLGWVTVQPGMFISVRSGGFVDTIGLGNTRWGGTGGFEHSFQPACDQVITTIGGRSGWILDRVYFGLSPEGGHDSIITRGMGGSGGSEFCWNPEKVGRIYRIGAHTDVMEGYQIISELRIESTM